MSTAPRISEYAAFRVKVQTVGEFSYEDMQGITDNFSEDNFIGSFQFGKLYHGMAEGIPLTVKTWEPNQHTKPGDNETRLRDEVEVLTYFHHMASHGCVPKLAGYCPEPGHLSIAYRLSTFDTLSNLLSEESFTWKERIKCAFGCASVLQFLHQKHPAFPYLIRNVHPSHILIDEDCNPILYEFSMITGGMITDRTHLQTQCVSGCYAASDPSYITGAWSDKCDVSAFGCMLLGLIMARICTYEDSINVLSLLNEWEHKSEKSIKDTSSRVLVHKSLQAGPFFYPGDADKITELALRCTHIDPQRRPSMKQVVECLRELHIVLSNGDELDLDDMIHDYNEKLTHIRKIYPEFRPLRMGRIDNVDPKYRFMLRPHTIKWNFSGDSVYMQSGQHSQIIVLSTEDLSLCTNGFNEANIIGNFKFGKLYHGNIDGRKVTVKIWKDYEIFRTPITVSRKLNEARQRDELDLLQHPELLAQPNALKVIGYCYEEQCLGIVYDVDSLGSLRNLIFKDSFTWLQRIKVIVGFACFLSFLHDSHPPHYCYLIRNIDADHIMVDQDYNSKLIDFGEISGGIFPDRTQPRCIVGCFGYIDLEYTVGYPWTDKCDVYAFGILLLGVIAKRICTQEEGHNGAPLVNQWAEKEYEAKKLDLGANKNIISLVHQSLEADKDFCFDDGAKITRLALMCVECFTGERPCMKKVVKQLLGLQVVKLYAKELDIAKMLDGCNYEVGNP